MKLSAAIYPGFCLLIITIVYTTFLACNILPQREALYNNKSSSGFYKPSEEEYLGVVVSFHVVFGMMLLCFFMASMTKPGYIPDSDGPVNRMRWRDGQFDLSKEDDDKVKDLIKDLSVDLGDPSLIRWLKSIVILERKKQFGYKRHCTSCQLFKPDRTHHCRICDRCILRMDHHCPWIANCVGYNNYKVFLLLLFYVICCLCFVLGGMARRLAYAFRPVLNTNTFLLEDLPVCIVYLLCLFLFIAVSMFFTFHVNLTLNNLTTIELREKKNSEDKYVVHRFKIAHAKFDNGWWANFYEVFGPPWMWLLPIFPGGDGTYLGKSLDEGVFDSADVKKTMSA